MPIIVRALLDIISGLLTNLSAGWFGSVLVLPLIAGKAEKIKLRRALTINMLLGTFVLFVAWIMKIYLSI